MGEIAGYYEDGNSVSHGFLRSNDGRLTVFDVPGAGTGAGQGTQAYANNLADVVTGLYIDSNGAFHGYLRIP